MTALLGERPIVCSRKSSGLMSSPSGVRLRSHRIERCRPWLRLALGTVCVVAGCTGAIDAPTAHTSLSNQLDRSSAARHCQDRSLRRIRRLSRREYLNTVSDLLGPDFAAEADPLLPPEANHAGFDNQDSALLVSPVFQEALATVAERLSAKLGSDALPPCDAPDWHACVEPFARSLARKAAGRPLEDDEVEHLMAAASTADDYVTAAQLAVEVVLQSPYLVYATELGPLTSEASSARVELTQYELASQLSLLLTAARPDDELLDAAEQGVLSDPAALRAQVDRLLDTPRAQEQLRLFVAGWLDMGPVSDAPKDPAVFPSFTPELAAAMQQEFDQFIDQRVDGGHGDLGALWTDTSTDFPDALMPIYQSDLLPDAASPTLDPDRRRGVLSLPAVLTYHSADRHSGPIERGLLVRRRLFCQSVPPPPDSVVQRLAAMPIDPGDVTKTTRQTYEAHVNDPFCSSCHDQFDPIGFGMEEIDGIGQYRTQDHGLPVDSNGELTGTDVDGSFDGVSQLSDKLSQSTMLQGCLAQTFFRFAAARVPEPEEQCVTNALAKHFVDNGRQLGELIKSYVTRPAFGSRKDDRQ